VRCVAGRQAAHPPPAATSHQTRISRACPLCRGLPKGRTARQVRLEAPAFAPDSWRKERDLLPPSSPLRAIANSQSPLVSKGQLGSNRGPARKQQKIEDLSVGGFVGAVREPPTPSPHTHPGEHASERQAQATQEVGTGDALFGGEGEGRGEEGTPAGPTTPGAAAATAAAVG